MRVCVCAYIYYVQVCVFVCARCLSESAHVSATSARVFVLYVLSCLNEYVHALYRILPFLICTRKNPPKEQGKGKAWKRESGKQKSKKKMASERRRLNGKANIRSLLGAFQLATLDGSTRGCVVTGDLTILISLAFSRWISRYHSDFSPYITFVDIVVLILFDC